MRAATADDRKDVADRLRRLDFPFDDHAAQVAWCRAAVASGRIMRDALTERLMRGIEVSQIAQAAGISRLRVFHYLSRGPDQETDGGNPWRLVTDPDVEAAA